MDFKYLCRRLRVQCLSLTTVIIVLKVIILVSTFKYNLIPSVPVEICISLPLSVATLIATILEKKGCIKANVVVEVVSIVFIPCRINEFSHAIALLLEMNDRAHLYIIGTQFVVGIGGLTYMALVAYNVVVMCWYIEHRELNVSSDSMNVQSSAPPSSTGSSFRKNSSMRDKNPRSIRTEQFVV